jgi:hypothetical protein
MLESDEQTIRHLRANDPHGRVSNNDIERAARRTALDAAIEDLPPSPLREILETMAALL